MGSKAGISAPLPVNVPRGESVIVIENLDELIS
jgi:hypothetical protein